MKDLLSEIGVLEDRCTDGLGVSHGESCCGYMKKCFEGRRIYVYSYSLNYLDGDCI